MAAIGGRVRIVEGYAQRGAGTVLATVLTAITHHPGGRSHAERWITVRWDDDTTSTERELTLTPA